MKQNCLRNEEVTQTDIELLIKHAKYCFDQ